MVRKGSRVQISKAAPFFFVVFAAINISNLHGKIEKNMEVL